MLSSLFSGDTSTLEWSSLLICIAASLLLGLLVAAIHMIRNVYTKNFVITLAVLPILVQSVIMLVNGNLGTGVAILGAFSLIRFRSVPGVLERSPASFGRWGSVWQLGWGMSAMWSFFPLSWRFS